MGTKDQGKNQLQPISSKNRNGLGALMLTLLVVVAFLGFLWWQSSPPPSSHSLTISPPKTVDTNLQPSPEVLVDSGLQARLLALRASFSEGPQARAAAHQALAEELLSLEPDEWVQAAPLLRQWQNEALPADYQHFIRKVLPRFQQQPPEQGHFFESEEILFSLPPGKSYQAAAFHNLQGLSPSQLEKKFDKIADGKRWVVSGAYTSPQHWPVGLTLVGGQILNPALQAFDGLLLISAGGLLQIQAMDSLVFGGRTFNLASHRQDYLDFLRLASREKLSVLQSHLLVQQGQLMTRNAVQAPLFRRRILFTTRDGGLHLFDSFSEKLSLYDAARKVQQQYFAWQAFNLDMGTFNFAVEYGPGFSRNYGDARNSIRLSNLLIFDF